MSWRHFYDSGSKLHIYIVISYDRYFSIYERNDYLFSDEMLVSWIIRIDCNSSISKHCFRSGSCENKAFFATYNWISDFPKISLFICIINFIICECCSASRTSIYNVLSLIDQSITVEVYKVLLYSF